MSGFVPCDMKCIFVSDIEGCETHGRFGKQLPQNTTMCETPFYEALDEKLSGGTTHVCFLGDYFDHGPGVLNSVVQIAKLKLKYDDKVHIILGNRDVNKFRIYFEQDYIFQGDISKDGLQNGPFYSNKVTPGAIGLNPTNMKQWMFNTMGIENDSNRNGLICGFDTELDALEAFKTAFSPANFSDRSNDVLESQLDMLDGNNSAAFSAAVNVIYKKGNLVEYIPSCQLLLSHAGGVHARKVTVPPVGKGEGEIVVGEETYYTTLLEKKMANIQTNKYATPSSTDNFTDIVKSYRDLYAEFLKLFAADTKTNTLFEHHYLIQGFGLEGGFIGSCGHTRHIPFHSPAKFDTINLLTDYPKYSAFGHVNYGLEYPIIYKRGIDRVMIACDTSVGFRPSALPFYMNMVDFSKGDGELSKYGILSYTATQTPSLKEHTYTKPLEAAVDGHIIEESPATNPARIAIGYAPVVSKGGKRTTQKRHSKKSKKKKVHRKKTRKKRKTKRTKR